VTEETVLEVARRLADPEAVRRVVVRAGNTEPLRGTHPWSGASLSHGWAGTALLFAELARTDQHWEAVGHEHLSAAASALPQAPGSGGLFSGPAAVALAAHALAAGRPRYTTLLDRLDGRIIADARARVAQERDRLTVGRGTWWHAYDVVTGLSGVARYLLHAAGRRGGDEAPAAALRDVLAFLVELTHPITVDGVSLPGWHVPHEHEPVKEDRKAYPHGDANLGLAHGIAGPLALLALAAGQGFVVPGQEQAIRAIADWLVRWRLVGRGGPYWPARVSFEDQRQGPDDREHFTRMAWCYGTPGTAHALLLAAGVLGEGQLARTVADTLAAGLATPSEQWRNVGPTFCHGRAGLLQLTRSAAARTDDLYLRTDDVGLHAAAEELEADLVGRFDPEAAFGFRHLVPDLAVDWRERTEDRGWHGLDVAGLLEGAAGVALTLLAGCPGQGTDGQGTDGGGGCERFDGVWQTAFLLR
jgi:hypothetical protein